MSAHDETTTTAVVQALLTAQQVGTMLGISARAVYELAARGALPSYRPLPGAVRFDPTDVQAYRTACRCATAAPVLVDSPRRPLILKVDGSGLDHYFRQAGVKPRPAPASVAAGTVLALSSATKKGRKHG